MYNIILIIHTIISIILIISILLQHGKGSDIGVSLNTGISNTIFGSYGINSFIFKFTSGLAVVFFLTSLTLSYIITKKYHNINEKNNSFYHVEKLYKVLQKK